MKIVLVISAILVFCVKSYGQGNITLCGNQKGYSLKSTKQIADSLKKSGIDSIIIYNHYKGRLDYSKILWASGNSIKQIQIAEKRLEKGFRKKTTESRILESRKQFDLFNLSTLKTESTRLKDCGEFVTPLPYHFLYLYINGQESCITVLEDQLECNTDNKKVKLIKELTMQSDEYYDLFVGKE